MADTQRGQFVIDCKSGEAAGIIYGLVHDKTLFRPELDLANAHPKEFDNEHISHSTCSLTAIICLNSTGKSL